MAKKLTYFVKIISSILVLTVSGLSSVKAGNNNGLTDQIVLLLNNNIDLPVQVRPLLKVKLLTPPVQLATLCPEPALSLSGNLSRLTGTHTLVAQCDAQRRFIQIQVDATGTWWQASHLIRSGTVISEGDIHPQRGSLEHLPARVIFDPQAIIGRIVLRAIYPGENLVASQLRQRWAINVGDKVEVSYQGADFMIRLITKALDNAALKQHVRLQTMSGKILSAIAIADDKATIVVGQ